LMLVLFSNCIDVLNDAGAMRGAITPGTRAATLISIGAQVAAVSGPCATTTSCATTSSPITRKSPVLSARRRLGSVLLLLLALDVALFALRAAKKLLRLALS